MALQKGRTGAAAALVVVVDGVRSDLVIVGGSVSVGRGRRRRRSEGCLG